MGLVLVTILLPIAAAALLLLLPRDDKTLSRVIGTLVAVFTFATVIAAGTARVERALALAAVRRRLPFRRYADLFLARAALDDLYGFGDRLVPRSRVRAISSRCMLAARRRDARALPRTRSAASLRSSGI